MLARGGQKGDELRLGKRGRAKDGKKGIGLEEEKVRSNGGGLRLGKRGVVKGGKKGEFRGWEG